MSRFPSTVTSPLRPVPRSQVLLSCIEMPEFTSELTPLRLNEDDCRALPLLLEYAKPAFKVDSAGALKLRSRAFESTVKELPRLVSAVRLSTETSCGLPTTYKRPVIARSLLRPFAVVSALLP